MNMNQVARSIGYPLEKWGGHCYSVVAAFLAAAVFDGAEPVTGYYHDKRNNVTDHAWLKLADGRICDPTRFWLEGKKRPSIFIGQADECYDDRGLRWAAELQEIRKKFIPDQPDLVAAFNLLNTYQDPQDRNPGGFPGQRVSSIERGA